MARTIVYPAGEPRLRGGGGGDDFRDKIAKLIPGEVLAFVVPVVATLKETDTLYLNATFWVGLIATPLYMAYAAKDLAPDKKPRPHFYLVALIAFAIWALVGFDKIGTSFGYDLSTARIVILPAWVLAAPIADWLLGMIFKRLWPSKYP